ncbi:MAG TPA: hypothetical protein VG370_18935 [Chloroflexota bacterium]|jgi:hypothetical protein|nr:hypothetical protein [Chloroflexota bacterium]
MKKTISALILGTMLTLLTATAALADLASAGDPGIANGLPNACAQAAAAVANQNCGWGGV